MSVRLGILLLNCIHATGSARAQESVGTARLERSIPAGFESLAAAQQLQVGIIFNNVQLGTVSATIDLRSITFDDPTAVATLVPSIADRSKVVAALSGPLALNAHLVCGERAATGCGQLVADVAGVIYDSSNTQVLLFVNPALRTLATTVERLRPQESEPALLGKIGLNLSGQADAGQPSYLLGVNTVAGSGRVHLRTQASLANDRSGIDQLHVRRVADGVEQVAGLFNAGYGSFLPPERLLGARFGSTLDDLPGDAGAYDVPLSIALASPATIDVFIGNRLIASARHDAGEARIDTSNFPAGAYTVRLRIREAGQERSEERFFARGTAFPPLTAPQTSFALGVRYPSAGFGTKELDEGPAWHLSHRRRLSDRLGVGGSLYGRDDSIAAELQFGASAANLQWAGAVFGSSAAEYAGAMSLRMQSGGWRLFGEARRMVTSTATDGADEHRFLRVREGFWQASFSLGHTIGQARLQTSALWRRGDRSRESWSLQPVFELPLHIAGQRLGLRVTGDLGSENQAVRFDIAVPAWHRKVIARTGARWQPDGDRTRPLYEAEVSDQRRLAPDTELRSNLLWRQDEGESLTASTALRSHRGSAFLALQSDLENHRNNYFGSAQSGFVWTRAGLDFTPADPGEAAVIYINNSPARAESVDAMLSKARIGTLQPQRRRAQAVAAFGKFAVGMLPARGTALSGSSPSRETTLFPGTVAIVDSQFVRVTAAFGRLVDSDKVPIAGAVLTASHGEGRTDAEGYFQIDVAAESVIKVLRSDGSVCRFALTAPPDDTSVYDAGDIECQ